MRYADKLRSFTSTREFRRGVKLIIVVFLIHLLANIVVVLTRVRETSASHTAQEWALTLLWWALYPLLFWAVVYVIYRFAWPALFTEKRLQLLLGKESKRV